MPVNELDEAVAKATGEDLRTIAWLGFVLLDPDPEASGSDSSQSNHDIDWDDIDLERYLAMCG